MGNACGNPAAQNPQQPAAASPSTKTPERNDPKGQNYQPAGAKPAGKPSPGGKDGSKAASSSDDDGEFLKHLNDLQPIFMTIPNQQNTKKYFISCSKRDKTLDVACISTTGDVSSASLGESELSTKKGEKIKDWASFFKLMRGAAPKASLKEQGGVSVTFPMEIPSGKHSVSFTLKTSQQVTSTVHGSILEPLCGWYSKRKDNNSKEAKDEDKYLKFESELNEKRKQLGGISQTVSQVQAQMEPLQQSAKQIADDATAAKEQCESVNKSILELQRPAKKLDLYPAAPVQFVLHTPHSTVHIPKFIAPNVNALHLVKQKYGGDTSHPPPSVGDVDHNAIMTVLDKIDDWDFDVFQLHQLTKGGALFMTMYCLLHKHGLVQHFKIKEETLINFLQAVESGYHPNPYHNSTHAADVLQITHYILTGGGMSEALKLTPDDTFASLMAACIHDFDHPGFNNNFHCRTGAYLAVLYNDRSVLENHHLAQVFDLVRSSTYNVFSSFTEEQKKDVRDTMIEMVLSTDMGLHAKIFQTFRKRLSENPDWGRKEDQRLALSIAIKMADISNCARPTDLYVQWAKMIADEFYNQGDAENKLKFTISPFMDRKKDKTDFSKGQTSFMNYIVVPLFEVGATFLPKLQFTVEKIHGNREYWAKKEAAAGAT